MTLRRLTLFIAGTLNHSKRAFVNRSTPLHSEMQRCSATTTLTTMHSKFSLMTFLASASRPSWGQQCFGTTLGLSFR
jgi:hypothetical protein